MLHSLQSGLFCMLAQQIMIPTLQHRATTSYLQGITRTDRALFNAVMQQLGYQDRNYMQYRMLTLHLSSFVTAWV